MWDDVSELVIYVPGYKFLFSCGALLQYLVYLVLIVVIFLS
jgi:hypothetical protein